MADWDACDAIDRIEFLHLGYYLLRFQLLPLPTSARLVGEVYYDSVRCAGRESGRGFSGCVLWVYLPRLDGGVQLVGD